MKMKLLLGILIGVLLTFGVAAPGHATGYFGYGDLIRVVYDATTNVEEATDLGPLSTILGKSGTQTLGSGLNVQLNDFGSNQAWGNLQVAYFAGNNGSAPTVTNPASYAVVSIYRRQCKEWLERVERVHYRGEYHR